MQILMITPYVPGPCYRVRAYNFLRYVGPRHDVDLAALSVADRDGDMALLRPLCRHITTVPRRRTHILQALIHAAFRRRPLVVGYWQTPSMHRVISDLVSQHHYDVLYVKQPFMAPYGLRVENVPRLLDMTDCASMFVKRLSHRYPWPIRVLMREEAKLLHRAEAEWVRIYECTIVSSPVDRRALVTDLPPGLCARVSIIPNAVDTEGDFPYADPRHSYYRFDVTYVSLLNRTENAEAALLLLDEIWPHIRAVHPTAQLRIVGPNAPRSVSRWHNPSEGVHVSGQVDNVARVIAESRVIIAPILTGAGTKYKVLQALAVGRPVVATPIAVEGLCVPELSGAAFVGNTPRDLAQYINTLLSNPQLCAEAGERARRYAEMHCSLSKLGKELETMLMDLVPSPRNRVSGQRT